MAKKTHAQSTKSCSDCVHEYACRMWTDGRVISDDSASRCPNHTTVKESAAYLIGKMDGEKHVILTADVAPRAEWISVEERLPLNFESVLVLATSRREDDGYDVLIAYHDRGEWEERSVHGDGGTVYAHVKYWMPLPEPPKGKQPKDSENYEKKRLLPGDCFHGEIWYMCPYCFTGIEAHSIPKDRICHKCGKEYL